MKIKEKDEVYAYIKENMPKTVKESYRELKPVVSPCIKEGFTTFFYWDTYFADLALLALGDHKQVENNLDNMRYMVETMGYVPNEYAPDIPIAGMNRSQPPLFSRSVKDYYMQTKDVRIVQKYLPALENEYAFWQTQRTSECGLNRYWHNATDEYLRDFCVGICERLRIEPTRYPDLKKQGEHFVSIAESGWDFTPRFFEKENAYVGGNYAPVDLNCILYDVERILSEFCALLGMKEKSDAYAKLAENRKTLINEYMLGKDGLYYDYDFVTKDRSPVLSAASCLPFAMGISEDKAALEKTVARLEGEYGLAACEKLPWECCDQWAYPSVWPPLSYFAYVALERLQSERAKPFAKKYVRTVRETYEKTGRLWEKYDAEKGGVKKGQEYETVEMLGWTAGVYMYLSERLRDQDRKAGRSL